MQNWSLELGELYGSSDKEAGRTVPLAWTTYLQEKKRDKMEMQFIPLSTDEEMPTLGPQILIFLTGFRRKHNEKQFSHSMQLLLSSAL